MSSVTGWKGGSSMASNPILAVDPDIDDQVIEFCESRPRLTPEQVIRDIARIACIVNLVRNGMLDGENTVLCGGMAMRCLDSPRMSVFDGDTSSRRTPDPDALRAAISYDDDEIEITAGPWQPGKDLITFRPINYTVRFSDLPGATNEFSLSISNRGVELPAQWKRLNHRYPFRVLAQDVSVPIMHPDEILAEKTVAWWLFGHAKHYNDIAFLVACMLPSGRNRDPEVRQSIRGLLETKLDSSRKVGKESERRVEALTQAARRRRLEGPDDHVDPKRGFNTLSYLHGDPPSRASVIGLIQHVAIPLLLD